MPDFNIASDSSVCLVTPHTNEALEWLEANIEHVPFGPAWAVEINYITPITIGMVDAGFEVHVDGCPINIVHGTVYKLAVAA